MALSGIKIGKEQVNILAYADGIVLIGKNETEKRQLFVEMENIARKLGLQINHEKTKYMVVERKNSLKKNEIEIRKRFVEMENIARKLGLQINQEKTK